MDDSKYKLIRTHCAGFEPCKGIRKIGALAPKFVWIPFWCCALSQFQTPAAGGLSPLQTEGKLNMIWVSRYRYFPQCLLVRRKRWKEMMKKQHNKWGTQADCVSAFRWSHNCNDTKIRPPNLLEPSSKSTFLRSCIVANKRQPSKHRVLNSYTISKDSWFALPKLTERYRKSFHDLFRRAF